MGFFLVNDKITLIGLTLLYIYIGAILRTPMQNSSIYRKGHSKIAYPYAQRSSYIDRKDFSCIYRKDFALVRKISPVYIERIMHILTQNYSYVNTY